MGDVSFFATQVGQEVAVARLGKGDAWLRGLPAVFQRLCANAEAFGVVDPTVEPTADDLDGARILCRRMHYGPILGGSLLAEIMGPRVVASEGAWRCFDVLNYDRCTDSRARRAAACYFLRAASERGGRRLLAEAGLRATMEVKEL